MNSKSNIRDKKIISVIVPIFNTEKYLNKCIDSICNQTYQDLEIILVDDGSTDDSGKICDEYASKDKRIKVIHKSNGGLSDARNKGLDIANGEFVAFVDGDDYIHPDMYAILLQVMNDYQSDIVCCDYRKVLEDEKIAEDCSIGKCTSYTGEEVIRQIWDDNVKTVVQWNKLYKTEIFSDIRYPIGRYHEDTFVIHHILQKCKIYTVVEQKLYYYVQHSDSIMSNFKIKRVEDAIDAYKERIELFEKIGCQEGILVTKKQIVNELMYIIDMQLRSNNINAAKQVQRIYRRYFFNYFYMFLNKKYLYLFVHYKLYARYNKI